MNSNIFMKRKILEHNVVGRKQRKMSRNQSGKKSSHVVESALNLIGNDIVEEKGNLRSTVDDAEFIGSMSDFNWNTLPLDADDHNSRPLNFDHCETGNFDILPKDLQKVTKLNTKKASLHLQHQQQQQQQQRRQRNDVTPEASERSATSSRFEEDNSSNNNNILKELNNGVTSISHRSSASNLPVPSTIRVCSDSERSIFSSRPSEGIRTLNPLNASLHQGQVEDPVPIPATVSNRRNKGRFETVIDIDDELSAAEFDPRTTRNHLKTNASNDIHDELSVAEFDLGEFDPLPIM